MGGEDKTEHISGQTEAVAIVLHTTKRLLFHVRLPGQAHVPP